MMIQSQYIFATIVYALAFITAFASVMKGEKLVTVLGIITSLLMALFSGALLGI